MMGKFVEKTLPITSGRGQNAETELLRCSFTADIHIGTANVADSTSSRAIVSAPLQCDDA